MSDWLMKVIKAEAKHLIALAAEDSELRADLRALAEEILAATEGRRDATEPERTVHESSETGQALETQIGPETTAEETVEPLRELTLGRLQPAKEERGSASTSVSRGAAQDDLEGIEERCRWKGEAARWAAERLFRMLEGNECPVSGGPGGGPMAEWADKLTNCFYWAKASESSGQTDPSLLEDVGGCFESLAEALASVRVILEKNQGTKVLERMLPLVAEAQSALRGALKKAGVNDDAEQMEVFEWVKACAGRHRIYLKRFMRADDVANPAGWPDLLGRIEAAAGSGQLSRKHAADLEALREHVKRIKAGENSEQEWQTVIRMVDELVGDGVPPSNRDIRDSLVGVLEDVPEREGLPDGFRRVLIEIDRYLARRSTASRLSVAHAPAAEVAEAAGLLRGRSVVLIGGMRRREAQEALRRALELSELIWIETKEHQSIDSFEPLIAKADVAVVLLAIRWSSHAFGDVREFCDRHDKPLVRLPGGYSPNQVAVQILAQCSGKLLGAGREPFSG